MNMKEGKLYWIWRYRVKSLMLIYIIGMEIRFLKERMLLYWVKVEEDFFFLVGFLIVIFK